MCVNLSVKEDMHEWMCVKTSVIVCLNVCECVCEFKCEYTNVSVSVFECVWMRVSECVCELCGVCVCDFPPLLHVFARNKITIMISVVS